MTLDTAKKNIKVMNFLNLQLVKVGSIKARKILNLLMQIYIQDEGSIKEEMSVLNTAIKKLDELDKNEAESALKYLIDLHMRCEFDATSEKEDNEIVAEDKVFDELPM
jgi:hypothetical protein